MYFNLLFCSLSRVQSQVQNVIFVICMDLSELAIMSEMSILIEISAYWSCCAPPVSSTVVVLWSPIPRLLYNQNKESLRKSGGMKCVGGLGNPTQRNNMLHLWTRDLVSLFVVVCSFFGSTIDENLGE